MAMRHFPKSVIVLAVLVVFLICYGCDDEDALAPTNPADMPYELIINPADFLENNIRGNTYFPIKAGTTFVYVGENEDGITVRVEEKHTGDTKEIMGVTCIVINAREYEDGELIEDTDDWYAQDLSGNIWYFGEASQEIVAGEVVSTAGSWEAGVDGALPGIIMLADPIVGIWYRQEYYQDEAEDVGQILSIDESLAVPYGSFDKCLRTAEWNLLEPGVIENKYYAPGVGLIRAVAVKGDSGYEDLVAIQPSQ